MNDYNCFDYQNGNYEEIRIFLSNLRWDEKCEKYKRKTVNEMRNIFRDELIGFRDNLKFKRKMARR